ncbi:hypothetical protein POTOM_000782 [Populus tomentosa]|uniref:Reticulon-like protein n=1 Tax=Populus tomentosa TaxID=118781 RepID=A0A8X8IUK2_POPTO|nr:hypothetical protein POTOM_000782 [Populus tomentosa]
MAEHDKDDSVVESVTEKISEKIHGHDSSSVSDSDHEKSKSNTDSLKSKIYRLFGREKPVHKVLGGGKRMHCFKDLDLDLCVLIALALCDFDNLAVIVKRIIDRESIPVVVNIVDVIGSDKVLAADVFLWRNKKISAGVLGGATAIWVLFELLEYNLVTLVCHCLILALALLFLWSNASTFINKSPPRIPEVCIPEEPVLQIAAALRIEINQGFSVLRDIASGRDLKKFLTVIAGLWVLSIVGSWCNFVTLFYIAFVLLHTVPVFYEKYEDQVDAFAEKAMIEIKKQYAVFDAKVLSKIPRGPLKDKKKD